jgi:dihydrofolate synthase/folylpolyglutamate synthase
MTYKEALDFINTASTPGSVYGLERIRALLNALGNPQGRLKFIHIAGTNGKGSVSRMLACVLTAAGYRVGSFNSPCLVSPCEYLSVSEPQDTTKGSSSSGYTSVSSSVCIESDDPITVNFNPVPATEEEFAQEAERVMEATLDLLAAPLNKDSERSKFFFTERSDSPISSIDISGSLRPTAFEYYTAMAIDFFARRDCDFAIMECGLGGMDDSTNVIPSPEVAVITRIGLDHTELLGDTLSGIAAAKAGIIKEGCSVVAYPSDKEAMDVIKETCKKKGCHISVVDPGKLRIVKEGVLEGDTVTYDGSEELSLSLLGSHQALNAAVVIEVVRALNDRIQNEPALKQGAFSTSAESPVYPSKYNNLHVINNEALRSGLAGTVWPARLMLMSKEPPVILDGAHNPQCMSVLCESLARIASKSPSTLDISNNSVVSGDSGKTNNTITNVVKEFSDISVIDRSSCSANNRFIIITGVMSDKDYKDMYRQLAPFAAKVYAVRPDNPRSLDPEEIVRIFEGYGIPASVSDSVTEAVELAKAEVANGPGADVPRPLVGVVVTGSLYMMKPLLTK